MRISINLFILLLTFSLASAQTKKKEITLQDIWASRVFVPQQIDEGVSTKDGEHYTTLDGDQNGTFILKYKYKTGKVIDTLVKSSTLIPADAKEPIDIENYELSPDEKAVLISTGTEPIYRHSTRSANYVYDFKTKKLTPLFNTGKQMYPTFSPSGSKVAFVHENNLYYKDLANNKEVQVTKDGAINSIINGATDWVYEEEFSFDRAYFWNADGTKLAYYKFDESEVKEFSFDVYSALYPSQYRYKYPKAGEANSKVNIFIHDLSKGSTTKVNIGTEIDQYIPRIKWTNDPNVLSVQRMNRLQNKLELLLVDAETGKSNVILTEESKTYIDITDNLTFLPDKKSFIWTSDKDGYNHIYHYDLSGKLIKQITSGNWEVIAYKGIEDASKTIIYTSTESGAINQDLYSIKLDGSAKKKLSEKPGFHEANFSEGFKYYINNYADANSVPVISLHSSNGKLIRVLEANEPLAAKMKEYQISKKEFFTFKNSDGIELNGWMIKPVDFTEGKKYPVFMHVYGGSGNNTVMNGWEGYDFFWHQLIAQKGYIVVSVDNRGTERRGAEFKKSIYKNLGKLEAQDQIDAAKYVGSLPYVDKSRIGIQGWSYGGYLTSLCMTKGAEYFKAGIAVAPVTNWRFYDSIYTERFLQTPQENASGYDENSPINFVHLLKGKYLLVHGTADDNVHFQNTAEMVNALVKANKQFDFMAYPNRNHGIYGGNARLHLFTLMTDFVLQNL